MSRWEESPYSAEEYSLAQYINMLGNSQHRAAKEYCQLKRELNKAQNDRAFAEGVANSALERARKAEELNRNYQEEAETARDFHPTDLANLVYRFDGNDTVDKFEKWFEQDLKDRPKPVFWHIAEDLERKAFQAGHRIGLEEAADAIRAKLKEDE
jgi:hypothetical protein